MYTIQSIVKCWNIFPVCLFFLRNKHHWDFWEISMMGKSFYHLRSEPAGKWQRVRMEQAGKGNSHRWPSRWNNLHFRNQLRAWHHWRNMIRVFFGGCFIHFSVGGSLLRDTPDSFSFQTYQSVKCERWGRYRNRKYWKRKNIENFEKIENIENFPCEKKHQEWEVNSFL